MITIDSATRLKIIKGDGGYIVHHYSKVFSEHKCYTKILADFRELVLYLNELFEENKAVSILEHQK